MSAEKLITPRIATAPVTWAATGARLAARCVIPSSPGTSSTHDQCSNEALTET